MGNSEDSPIRYMTYKDAYALIDDESKSYHDFKKQITKFIKKRLVPVMVGKPRTDGDIDYWLETGEIVINAPKVQ